MATVVRLGPLPLLQRRAARVAELERVIGERVDLIEVFSVDELVGVVNRTELVAVVVDASGPGELDEATAAAGRLPVLRPLWRQVRNSRGEIDEVFDGYGLLTNQGVIALADGESSI